MGKEDSGRAQPGRQAEGKEDASAMISKILHATIRGNTGRVGSTRNKTHQPFHSFISSSVCRLHAGFSAPNRKTTSWMRGFKSTFGEMERHVWDGQDVSSQERRWEPGRQRQHGSLWRKGGFGVMEGAFQRYTE